MDIISFCWRKVKVAFIHKQLILPNTFYFKRALLTVCLKIYSMGRQLCHLPTILTMRQIVWIIESFVLLPLCSELRLKYPRHPKGEGANGGAGAPELPRGLRPRTPHYIPTTALKTPIKAFSTQRTPRLLPGRLCLLMFFLCSTSLFRKPDLPRGRGNLPLCRLQGNPTMPPTSGKFHRRPR